MGLVRLSISWAAITPEAEACTKPRVTPAPSPMANTLRISVNGLIYNGYTIANHPIVPVNSPNLEIYTWNGHTGGIPFSFDFEYIEKSIFLPEESDLQEIGANPKKVKSTLDDI